LVTPSPRRIGRASRSPRYEGRSLFTRDTLQEKHRPSTNLYPAMLAGLVTIQRAIHAIPDSGHRGFRPVETSASRTRNRDRAASACCRERTHTTRSLACQNTLAAHRLSEVPWHITGPAAWAILVELTAKQVLGQWKATHAARNDSISLALWASAPVETARTKLLMLRTGISDAHDARIAVGLNAAAHEAVRLTLARGSQPPNPQDHLPPATRRQPVSGGRPPLGWALDGPAVSDTDPDAIALAAILHIVLAPPAPARLSNEQLDNAGVNCRLTGPLL